MKILEDYEMFELVEDVGQEYIGSRWLIMQKENHDGKKTQVKARLVAQSFQKKDKPQSDLLNVAKNIVDENQRTQCDIFKII